MKSLVSASVSGSFLCFCLAALVVTPTAAAAAQALPPTEIVIPRVADAPSFADYLEGGSRPGLRITDFRQREPLDLAPGSQATEAYVSYDGTRIYAAFICRQPMATLRARMQKREDIHADDLVGLYLDTFYDRQRAYLFYASPLGVQADGVMTENNGEDFSFDTEWSSHGEITPDGYVVLISVPFKSLRFPATADGQQRWGFGLVRSIRSANETDFWPGNTKRVNGFIAQFATATGVSNVSPGRNLQLTPYGTFTGARFRDAASGGFTRKDEGRAGLDFKLVPRDAMALDFTVNPDFSQVESDEPQVTVNQRFEVFFPEKRPFFLENADFFDSMFTLFFSRRIRDPQFGARMTGKVGQWATGALLMDDRAPGRLVPPTSSLFEHRSVNVVGSARRDFANQSNVGFFGTSRTFGDAANQVGSTSAHVRLNQNWFVDAQVVASRDRDVAGASRNGAATFFGLIRNGRSLNYSAAYNGVSPGFRTSLGFVPRTDMQDVTSFFSYRWYPKTGIIQNLGPNSYIEAIWDYDGRLQDTIVRYPFFIQFKGRTSAFVRHSEISETVGGTTLDQREEVAQVETSFLRWLDVTVSWAEGTKPNYFPANGQAPFLADFNEWNVGVTLKPISRLGISQTFIQSRLDGRAGTVATGAPIFDNRLWRSRVNYQFSREWSLRAILDYSTLDQDARFVDLGTARRFSADVLLTWLLHPGTALYLGYTDGYDTPTSGSLGRTDRLRSTGRQVFLKSSWLLRF
jgi:hypothetical protein